MVERVSPSPQRARRIFGRRYQTATLLKSALHVETWLGTDLTSGDAVVIKHTAATRVSPSAQLRLVHEADTLRNLACPGIAPVLDLGREGSAFYLVRPFLKGVTLADRVARAGTFSAEETLGIGRGLLRTLSAAHQQSVAHRDLKPTNVLLPCGASPERITVIDFGLARSAGGNGSGELPVETAAYVSPEQAGLIHFEVGERSDLYSAGIVLFECLAGRPPFAGATVGDVLRQHLSAEVPPLRELGRAVPHALEAVIGHLLEKDPRNRYPTAADALNDLDRIAAAMGRGQTDPSLTVTAPDRRHRLSEPAFVGREQELRIIEEELERAGQGEPVTLVLEGASGVGKSRLLEQAAMRALQRGAWVLRGQAVDRSVRRPLQVLDPIVAEVAQTSRREPELAYALRARIGDRLETLCAALPQLIDLCVWRPGAPPGPEVYGEARTLAALIDLVDALGSTRPAVIVLDDGQWLDELSLKLLAEWHRVHHGTATPSSPVLLIVAYRGEEVSPSSPLRALPGARRISLGPLAERDVSQLAESMAGPLPAEATGLVQRLSVGNPFLAEAVLDGLVESGALVAGTRGWELEPHAMARAQSSRRAAAFVAQRLDGLSASAMELLSVGAVLGKAFELKLAADLADQPAAEAMDGVAEARRRHLLWMDAPGGRCTFLHDRLRAAVLRQLTPAAQRDLHSRAADLLDRAAEPGPDREFDLAYHLDAAGDHRRALPHALAAAGQARARYALEMAERYYRIAERGASDPSVTPDARRQVKEELGDVLLLRGEYPEAGAALAEARELAGSAVARARIEGKIGELAFKRGDVRAAATALESALRLLGRKVPRRRIAVLAATMWQAIIQLVHTLLPACFVARRSLKNGEADRLAARILSRLAYAHWFLRGQMATFWAHLTELNLAERYPPTRELAQACSEHSISVTGLPRALFGRGVRYAVRGQTIRRALGDLWGQGQSLNFHGMLLYAFGHYAAALAKFQEALRLLRRTGDRWEANVAGFHIALCRYRLGSLREAVAESRRVYAEALEIGDGHARAVILEVWAKASGGAVPEELVAAALQSSKGDPLTHQSVLQAEGVRLLGAGRPREAAAAFEAAERVARSAHLKNEYVSYVPLWLARAYRLSAAQAAREAGVLVRGPLEAAGVALRRGLPLARRHRGNLPLALRERGQLHAMRGHPRRARRDLDASLAEARRQGARYEAVQSLLARSELGRLLGWRDAEAGVAQARRELRELGAEFVLSTPRLPASEADQVTLSLADRFASIVDQGRRVSSALCPDDVHAALCEAARVLLRGQSTLVLALDGPEPRTLAQSGPSVDLTLSLVERAGRDHRPALLSELLDQPLAESLAGSARSSALCAPILVRGQTAACLYVAHALVGDLFCEEEKRLAGYLVTLAGASLEKAEAFADLQALSHSLEERVATRTSELRAANAELDAKLRQLREAQSQLVQAARMAAVGTLVASLSHEINNPLAVILGQAQICLRSLRGGDPLRPGVVAIETQARRCAELVGTLLDFSRRRPDDAEDVEVGSLVSRVVALESTKLRRQNMKLEVAGAVDLSVRVSRTQIESALLNLLDNAVDASPRGAVVRVEAGCSDRRESGQGVELRVRDQGSGIDPELLSRVFDPFFTTKPAGKGTGLGLALARQFVEGQGGHLSIESQPGRGTVARLWLPAARSPAPPPRS